jgi:hypothetical protein
LRKTKAVKPLAFLKRSTKTLKAHSTIIDNRCNIC